VRRMGDIRRTEAGACPAWGSVEEGGHHQGRVGIQGEERQGKADTRSPAEGSQGWVHAPGEGSQGAALLLLGRQGCLQEGTGGTARIAPAVLVRCSWLGREEQRKGEEEQVQQQVQVLAHSVQVHCFHPHLSAQISVPSFSPRPLQVCLAIRIPARPFVYGLRLRSALLSASSCALRCSG